MVEEERELSLTPGENSEKVLVEVRQVKDIKQVRGMDYHPSNDVKYS